MTSEFSRNLLQKYKNHCTRSKFEDGTIDITACMNGLVADRQQKEVKYSLGCSLYYTPDPTKYDKPPTEEEQKADAASKQT